MCCSFVPDKVAGYDLRGCCCLHDDDYAAKNKTRRQADRDFLWCLLRVAPPAIAYSYYYGVRLVGWMCW
jgi:hypothetical protein